MSGARSVGAPGFGLAEVLVALVVLTVGIMGAVATATLAVRTLHMAAEREAAVRAAGVVLDSLLQVRSPSAGEREFPRHRVRWTVRTEGRVRRIALEVESIESGSSAPLRFEALHAPALPRLGGEP